jgi:metallo-beta-lactamase class B
MVSTPSLRVVLWFSGAILSMSGCLPAAEQASAAPTPAASGVDRATVARWFESWKAPVPPRHLIGNIYYVGATGVSSFLITTDAGHILLDTGFEDTVPVILRSVELLGFRLSDVKLLLSSHAHVDHVGGHALMQRLTGARVIASAADARLLASGGADDFTPLPPDLMAFAPVTVDQVVGDRETVSLGNVSLTAHLTPGHTRGATTWTMSVTADGREYAVVFFSSASINPGTVLLNNPRYPEIVQDYEATFTRLRELPCDVFLAPHGGQFAMVEKFARLDRGAAVNPFIDPPGWETVVAEAERIFRDQLAAEKAAAGSRP